MTDLGSLEALAAGWRRYLASAPAAGDNTRNGGFLAGLAIAADQLEETLARMKAESEA